MNVLNKYKIINVILMSLNSFLLFLSFVLYEQSNINILLIVSIFVILVLIINNVLFIHKYIYQKKNNEIKLLNINFNKLINYISVCIIVTLVISSFIYNSNLLFILLILFILIVIVNLVIIEVKKL